MEKGLLTSTGFTLWALTWVATNPLDTLLNMIPGGDAGPAVLLALSAFGGALVPDIGSIVTLPVLMPLMVSGLVFGWLLPPSA